MLDKPRKLSKDELTACSELFSRFDRDGSGGIDVKELKPALRALWLNPTEKEIKEIIKRFAQDKKALTKDEFLNLMSFQPSADEEVTQLRAAFKRFDRDGSGAIDMKELGARMKEMGTPLSDKQLKQMMKEADTNKDGFIDINEFVAIMMHQH